MASSVDLGKQREGTRMIHKRGMRVAALDASIARGVADAHGGNVHDIDDAAAILEAKYAKMIERR